MSDAELRRQVEGIDVPQYLNPAFVHPVDLSSATVGIVTTAGLHAPSQQRLERGDEGFHRLSAADPNMQLGHVSPNFDKTGFVTDRNVVVPYDRLVELAKDGVIESVAPNLISFMGAQHGTLSTIRWDSGPAAARELHEDGVDVALLSGMCPMCTRTLGAVAHALEAAGIATVLISSVRGISERIRPPRALQCNFPFGRPYGRPLDSAFQKRVIVAALGLVNREQGPVLEDFPEAIDENDGGAMVCEIPPHYDSSLNPAVDEALALRPAYERQQNKAGFTAVGRAVSANDIPRAIQLFIDFVNGSVWLGTGPESDPREVASDVRSYYEEAAMGLSDSTFAAVAPQDWFFTQTATGSLLQ